MLGGGRVGSCILRKLGQSSQATPDKHEPGPWIWRDLGHRRQRSILYDHLQLTLLWTLPVYLRSLSLIQESEMKRALDGRASDVSLTTGHMWMQLCTPICGCFCKSSCVYTGCVKACTRRDVCLECMSVYSSVHT